MSKKYYVPTNKPGKLQLLTLFSEKLPSYITKYGITNTQRDDMIASAAYLEYCFHSDAAVQQYDQSVTQYIDSLMNGIASGTLGGLPAFVPLTAPATVPAAGIFDRLVGIVNVIKNHPAYVVGDGEDMGIEGAEHIINEDALQPQLTVAVIGSGVYIKCPKGDTQGFEVWVDRGNGTFVFIGFATSNKFNDPAALPAAAQTWKYKAIYHLHDAQVGQWSNVITIHVGA